MHFTFLLICYNGRLVDKSLMVPRGVIVELWRCSRANCWLPTSTDHSRDSSSRISRGESERYHRNRHLTTCPQVYYNGNVLGMSTFNLSLGARERKGPMGTFELLGGSRRCLLAADLPG